MRYIIYIITILSPIFLFGCSSSDTCISNDNFKIEYFYGGGFTGIEKGLIISCDGTVKYWTRNPGVEPIYTDSLKLEPEDIDRLSSLITDDLFEYSISDKGDYTTTLILTKDNRKNSISFIGTNLAGDAPDYLIKLITEIKKINKD